jgi:DNA-binding NarL/FixJ family response regulator
VPFVGREGELDLLLTSVARAPATGLVAVVVEGDAGIGKSRLITEAGRRLAAQGWPVVAVLADRLERQVPYGALLTALRAVNPDNTFTQGLCREARAALDISGVPETDLPFARACAAVTRLFTALTAANPLGLVVDDLHEMDDDSLALLAVVLRRLAAAPIGLVTAVRRHLPAPNTAAAELLERLTGEVEVVPVELGTPPPAELGRMIAPLLGGAPDDGLVAEVHDRADGNPFFAVEVARSLAEARLVVVEGERARLTVEPGTVHLTRRDAVLRRVMPLTSDARAVARTLAVLRTVRLDRLDLVAEVSDRSPVAIATAFDDLVRANVVVHDAGRHRFAHDIVADALYDDIGPAECRRLHRAVAERLLAERDPADLLELAWHVSESAVPGDKVAVAVLTDAAGLALARAPEAAAGFCAKALALLPDGADERAGLLSLRCRALARASRPAAAVPAGQAALELLPAGDDRARTVTALTSSLFSLGRIADAIEVVDAEIGTGPGPAALHAQRAHLLVLAGRQGEGEAEAARASAIRPVSPAEEVVVNGQLTMLASLLARHREAIGYADRALTASGTSTTLQLQALAIGASMGSLAGLVADATARLRRAERLAEEAPYAYPGELGLSRVALDWLGGRWDAALEAMPRVAAELTARQQAPLAAALTAIQLEIRTWRGELVLAARLVEQAAAAPVPLMANMANLHALALAGYHMVAGDLDAARKVLVDSIGAELISPYNCLLLGRLAELELAVRDPDAAERAAARLIEVSAPRYSPWSKTTRYRIAGVVHGDAVALRQAVAEAEAGGLVFERARAQLALGELVPDVVDGLVEAHRTFARVGAHGLRRQAARRLQDLGAKVPRSRSRSGGLLTESEERVARLVQQGMRNREIAAALHYSPRSIEVYLSRVYAKLRVSSRLELARALDALDDRRP